MISVLLSINPGAGGAPFHASFSRTCLVSGKKSSRTPLSSSAWRTSRRCKRSLRFALNERCSRTRKAVASLFRILRVWSLRGPRIETPWMIASLVDMLKNCCRWRRGLWSCEVYDVTWLRLIEGDVYLDMPDLGLCKASGEKRY